MNPNTGSYNYLFQDVNNFNHYAVPGIPYVTASTLASGTSQFKLPFVSKRLIVRNVSGADVQCGFSLDGVTSSNYFTITASQEVDITLRTAFVFFQTAGASNIEIIGELSSIRNINRDTWQNTLENLYGTKQVPGGTIFIPKFL
jgi:hypothetical protein